METNSPGSWVPAETRFPFQQNRWQNEATGHFLVIEVKEQPWHEEDEGPDLCCHLISENFEDRPDPIRTIIEKSEDKNEVLRAAHEYMKGHPDGPP